MKHVPYAELLRQLEDTPIEQVVKLMRYSEEQAVFHQGYKDLLQRVIKHRQKAARETATAIQQGINP